MTGWSLWRATLRRALRLEDGATWLLALRAWCPYALIVRKCPGRLAERCYHTNLGPNALHTITPNVHRVYPWETVSIRSGHAPLVLKALCTIARRYGVTNCV